jgi:hypothetical protein
VRVDRDARVVGLVVTVDQDCAVGRRVGIDRRADVLKPQLDGDVVLPLLGCLEAVLALVVGLIWIDNLLEGDGDFGAIIVPVRTSQGSAFASAGALGSSDAAQFGWYFSAPLSVCLLMASRTCSKDYPIDMDSVVGSRSVARGASAHPSLGESERTLIGAAALGFSVLYLLSDLMELAQGGFSTAQLTLTYVSEAAIPLFVIGIYAVQRPAIGRLGFVGAVGYAYAFVFFTSTVVYALVEDTPDWNALTDQMGSWITLHSLLMVVAGLAFGFAVLRAGVLPGWTGSLLMAGMVAMVVASFLPGAAQTGAAALRDIAFAGMGASVLRVGDRPIASPLARDGG